MKTLGDHTTFHRDSGKNDKPNHIHRHNHIFIYLMIYIKYYYIYIYIYMSVYIIGRPAGRACRTLRQPYLHTYLFYLFTFHYLTLSHLILPYISYNLNRTYYHTRHPKSNQNHGVKNNTERWHTEGSKTGDSGRPRLCPYFPHIPWNVQKHSEMTTEKPGEESGGIPGENHSSQSSRNINISTHLFTRTVHKVFHQFVHRVFHQVFHRFVHQSVSPGVPLGLFTDFFSTQVVHKVFHHMFYQFFHSCFTLFFFGRCCVCCLVFSLGCSWRCC